MEYFRSSLKSVLGSQPQDDQNSASETVLRLIERIQHCTLLKDRKDACRDLKDVSKKFRVEVGAFGMDTLCQVLENDRRDNEIVSIVLWSLLNVMDDSSNEGQDLDGACRRELLGEEFTEIFIKHPENVGLILGLMEEYEFNVRWPAVKLFSAMLTNKPKEIQEIVLLSPMGVSKLMDLLGDSREVIRNDALLLLMKLAKGNANIQKIIAFEMAFDRIFDVMEEEGYLEGGIVVEDCLLLLLTLLRNNISNQNFFKEGSYIIKLVKMFDVPAEMQDSGWSSQKVSIIHLLLEVVRTLVNPGNPAQATASCQQAMHSCGLLALLCLILMARGVPASLLPEAMNTVAEVIRGTQTNQDYFCGVTAPSSPPRPAVVALLMSMVNEKQPFALRLSVLYCFQCYLYKNEAGQAQIIQTLLPSSAEVGTLTAGQLLCGGIFNSDPLSNWFSAVALSHCLIENPAVKEQLLCVLLFTNPGSPPVSLLQQCTTLLQQGSKNLSKLGLLMLLSTWLSLCPAAVKEFLSIPSSIPYLTSQAGSNEHDENEELVQGLCAFLMGICIKFNDNDIESYSQENLRQLIVKRIGLEHFLDKLGKVSRHESYSKAVKQPQPQAKQSNELFLDHEFCRLYKALEGNVIKAVMHKPQSELANGAAAAERKELLANYIRQRDDTIKDMMNVIEQKDSEIQRLKSSMHDTEIAVKFLKEHNSHLEAHYRSYMAVLDMEMKTADHHVIKRIDEKVKKISRVILKEMTEKGLDNVLIETFNRHGGTIVTVTVPSTSDAYMQTELSNEEDVKCLMAQTNAEGQRIEGQTNQMIEDLARQLKETGEELTRARLAEEKLSHLQADHEDLLELVADQQTEISELQAKLESLQVPPKVEDGEFVLSVVEANDD